MILFAIYIKLLVTLFINKLYNQNNVFRNIRYHYLCLLQMKISLINFFDCAMKPIMQISLVLAFYKVRHWFGTSQFVSVTWLKFRLLFVFENVKIFFNVCIGRKLAKAIIYHEDFRALPWDHKIRVKFLSLTQEPWDLAGLVRDSELWCFSKSS